MSEFQAFHVSPEQCRQCHGLTLTGSISLTDSVIGCVALLEVHAEPRGFS